MDLAAVPAWLEASALATAIRNSLYLFALIESFHVVGVSIVVGTVLVIDLRLLGLASSRRPFTAVATDVFRWTWIAFALAVATGALMFVTNATSYYVNTYFRVKMAMLVLAGINIGAFELTARRSVAALGSRPGRARGRQADRGAVAGDLDRRDLPGAMGRLHAVNDNVPGERRDQPRRTREPDTEIETEVNIDTYEGADLPWPTGGVPSLLYFA